MSNSIYTYKWTLLHTLASEHRIFRDENTGQLAIADNSGTYPDRTEDGVLWLAPQCPAQICYEKNFGAVVSLNVWGPRVGALEEGKHTGVYLEDVPVLFSLGYRFTLSPATQKQADAWGKLMAVLALQKEA